jgi:ubiquinone/menaquinone biosynthesis C-methylase UbiE
VIYQDPLAYLLGLEGIALLDAWAGDHDRAFTEARLAEIRRLLDDDQLRDRGVVVERVSAATVYEQVSAGYDAEAGGGLFAADEPVVAEYLASREPGVALDAACGTGRFAEFLAKCGHGVIGVDSSPDMLAYARRRVPEAEFHVAELDALPLPDDSVDVIVCALALEHVPRLDPVLAEFARVLRPGGDLVISDVHHELVTRGSTMTVRGPAGAYLPASARRLPAAGTEAWPAGQTMRGAARDPNGRTATRTRNRDRRLDGLAVLADGLPAFGNASRWRSPGPGYLALPATRTKPPLSRHQRLRRRIAEFMPRTVPA